MTVGQRNLRKIRRRHCAGSVLVLSSSSVLPISLRRAMTSAAPARPQPAADRFAVLREIERRVLWLSTAVIHHANRVRPNPSRLTNPTKSRQTPSST
jgi:hypothetical protein